MYRDRLRFSAVSRTQTLQDAPTAQRKFRAGHRSGADHLEDAVFRARKSGERSERLAQLIVYIDNLKIVMDDDELQRIAKSIEEADSRKTRKRAKDWRSLGLIREPTSEAQADLAIAAREEILGLKCYEEVRKMLANGRSARDVAHHIHVTRDEAKARTRGTLTKYVQVFRQFCIPPLELVQQASPPSKMRNALPAVQMQASRLLAKGVQEATVLDSAIQMQVERINAARTLEKKLGGFMMLTLGTELERLTKMCSVLQDMKSDLGFPGYMRVPIGVKIQGPTSDPFQQLTEVERTRVFAFGNKLLEIFNPPIPEGTVNVTGGREDQKPDVDQGAAGNP